MSQTLPKTDSREFEVADSQPTPAPFEVASTPEFEAWIRFWSKGPRGFEPMTISVEPETIFVQMVSDLVAAGGGSVQPDPKDALVARFPTLAKAAGTAKRVQRCVEAFAAHSGESASLGIAICAVSVAPPDTDRSSASVNLLAVARPGRIVLTEQVWKELETLPGLRLRKLTSGLEESQSALRELVWTPVPESPEQQSSQVQLRRIVNDAGERSGNRRPADDSPTAVSVPGMLTTAEPIPPPADIFEASARRNWLLIRGGLVVAVILVVVFSTLIFLSSRRNLKPRSEQPQPLAGPAQTVAPAQPLTAPTTATSENQSSSSQPSDGTNSSPPPVVARPATTAAGADLRKKPAKRKESADIKQNPQSTDQGARSCSSYAPNEVPYLLAQADKEAGAGQYSEAIHAYDVVLCLDPGNVRAKQGKHRAKLSIGEQD